MLHGPFPIGRTGAHPAAVKKNDEKNKLMFFQSRLIVRGCFSRCVTRYTIELDRPRYSREPLATSRCAFISIGYQNTKSIDRVLPVCVSIRSKGRRRDGPGMLL